MSQILPLGVSIAIFSAIASGIMIVMLMLLPETRGRSLAALEAGATGAAAPGTGLERQPAAE